MAAAGVWVADAHSVERATPAGAQPRIQRVPTGERGRG